MEKQIQADITFDDMIDSLNQSYETLKNGTDIETMRKITHRYITDIYIEPWEGKATSFWKKVTIKTIHDTDKKKKIEQFKEQGLDGIIFTLKDMFYVNTLHKKAYWNEDMMNCVPMVYIERITRKRGKRTKKKKMGIRECRKS
ncbi:hypothetical protein [Phocaeicola vulgatus]|nr:hypothetical protein [Phocaeicola vulgatus]MDC1727362.1 hypothetical protein [Phocaeicola vulgatus]